MSVSEVNLTDSQNLNAVNRLKFTCLSNESSPSKEKLENYFDDGKGSHSSFQEREEFSGILDLTGKFTDIQRELL